MEAKIFNKIFGNRLKKFVFGAGYPERIFFIIPPVMAFPFVVLENFISC
jgi:hypothetical protein